MADVTVSTDIDTLLKSADNAAARDSLGVIEYPVTGLVSSGDNSATIQAVIDSVAAKGGGDIVIPAGIWEIA